MRLIHNGGNGIGSPTYSQIRPRSQLSTFNNGQQAGSDAPEELHFVGRVWVLKGRGFSFAAKLKVESRRALRLVGSSTSTFNSSEGIEMKRG